MQSPLAQPVSYAQQQYQQPYEQGQYTYPFPMVPMTMPYMGQHYDASSPQHAGKPGRFERPSQPRCMRAVIAQMLHAHAAMA